MSQIDVNNYSIFPGAATVSRSSQAQLNESITIIEQELKKLDSEDIFAGPIASSIAEGAKIVTQNLSTAVNKISSVPIFAGIVDSNYQNTDKTTSTEIGGVVS